MNTYNIDTAVLENQCQFAHYFFTEVLVSSRHHVLKSLPAQFSGLHTLALNQDSPGIPEGFSGVTILEDPSVVRFTFYEDGHATRYPSPGCVEVTEAGFIMYFGTIPDDDVELDLSSRWGSNQERADSGHITWKLEVSNLLNFQRTALTTGCYEMYDAMVDKSTHLVRVTTPCQEFPPMLSQMLCLIEERA